ncbi:MAG: hypothetical protein WCD49_10935 [Candidatus Acidiferrales bacterium]
MKMCRAVILFVAIATFAISRPTARAQSSSGSGTAQSQTQTAPPPAPSSSSLQLTLSYHRPSETEKLKNYAFDSFGPYAFFGAAVAGAYQQAVTTNATPHISGSPPDWGQGWDSYGVRVASNFGINLVTQTARYTLAEVFREDTLYYRCECSGIFPRVKHALISTVTARRGEDGHRFFSFASLAAPYAGGETAALLWYPGPDSIRPRGFGPMDGFRIGNYNLLVQAGLNLALEFVYGGPHTLLSQHHVPMLSNATGSHPDQQ